MPPYLAVKDEEKHSGQAESDSSDGDDWDLPLTFNKPRHIEPIKGAERVEHTWRVKEKVRLGRVRRGLGATAYVCATLRMTTNAHGLSAASLPTALFECNVYVIESSVCIYFTIII